MNVKIPYPLMTPKARFIQSNVRCSNHRELISGPVFEAGSDTALLQYCAELSNSISDPNTALAAAYRLQGAFQFLMGFKNLSEMPSAPAQVPQQNLDHKA